MSKNKKKADYEYYGNPVKYSREPYSMFNFLNLSHDGWPRRIYETPFGTEYIVTDYGEDRKESVTTTIPHNGNKDKIKITRDVYVRPTYNQSDTVYTIKPSYLEKQYTEDEIKQLFNNFYFSPSELSVDQLIPAENKPVSTYVNQRSLTPDEYANGGKTPLLKRQGGKIVTIYK